MGWELEIKDGFGCRYRIERFKVFGFTVMTRWKKV